MSLHERVESYVSGWRFLFTVVCTISIGTIIYQGDFSQLLYVLPLAFLIYHLGFWAMVHWLIYSSPAEMVIEEIQNQKIQEINARLASGDLAPGPELDDLLKDAGLRPLTVISEYGPVIGKFQDLDFYEWITAREGHDGPQVKFNFVGKCERDHAGNFKTPASDKQYIVFDEILYESAQPTN